MKSGFYRKLWFCTVVSLFQETSYQVRLIREIVFWIYTDIQRKERRPLPGCVVLKVRATFPPTDNEEEFADWQFTGFVYGDPNMPDN